MTNSRTANVQQNQKQGWLPGDMPTLKALTESQNFHLHISGD
jgi:hypothetical protein